MNANSESSPLPDAEAAVDAAEGVAKPARRPRAPKVKVDAAAVEPVADAASGEAPEAAVDAPPKPRRRRTVPVAATSAAAPAGEPGAEVTAVDNAPKMAEVRAVAVADAEPPAAARREVQVVDAPAHGGEPADAAVLRHEARSPAEGRAIGDGGVQNPAPREGQGEVQGEAQGEEQGDGTRGRRRNRRDRKRGERGEMGADQTGRPPEAGDGQAVAPDPAAAMVEASAVFAQVLSGDFDVEEAEPPVDEEAAASKRVLAPEPEAPKLHKVLAQAGIGSRRDMEELILDGSITVNGEPAHIGQRISFGDQVKVSGKPVKFRIMPLPPRIIAYHKPVGEIVTHDDPQNRPTVFRRLPRLQQGKWQSVGRLDINTEGLLLFTNSGELANQLMHPRFGVEREYAVRVLGELTAESKAQLIEGVMVEGQKCGFRSVEEGGGEGANHWYHVTLSEGRNREVRRMFEAVGVTVSRLMRVRYGPVQLPPQLKRGQFRELSEVEIKALMAALSPPQIPDNSAS